MEPGPNSTKRSLIVRASNDQTQTTLSELSCMDLMQPNFFINLAFFYDYIVAEGILEGALEMLLNRYPEMSGRLNDQSTAIILNNAGAELVFAQDSEISIDHLRATNFNVDFCSKTFLPDDSDDEEEFLLKITVQKLASKSGMMVNFRAGHLICDINSFYLLISDFCSLVAKGKYHFETITQGDRLGLAVPSGNIPVAEHSDVVAFDSVDEMISKLNEDLEDQRENLVATVTLTCDVLSQKQLKTDICRTSDHLSKTKNNGTNLSISTNDCILSLIHQAYVETRPEKLDVKCTGSLVVEEHPPISIAVNVRQRLNPKVPVTQFGNLSISILTRVTKNNPDTGLYGIATCIREDVNKIDENYCQSYFDFIAGSNLCQHACFFDRSALLVTNWNKLYDWYGSTSLGQGPPQKMVYLNRKIDRMCLIMPSEKVGDIDIHISLSQEQMAKFKEHINVKSYFVMN
ncbi:uncharacterized protein LOC142350632 [Convolutriloba macropyga]|uniref:uncharacterized protein LOC142350632 n=1 Tax=Convolutriloba macropyga TaxID=536237 RepID=UPI003F527E01